MRWSFPCILINDCQGLVGGGGGLHLIGSGTTTKTSWSPDFCSRSQYYCWRELTYPSGTCAGQWRTFAPWPPLPRPTRSWKRRASASWGARPPCRCTPCPCWRTWWAWRARGGPTAACPPGTSWSRRVWVRRRCRGRSGTRWAGWRGSVPQMRNN